MEKLLKELKEGINLLESNKLKYPKSNTQDVINLLERVEYRVKQLNDSSVRRDSLPTNDDIEFEMSKRGIKSSWDRMTGRSMAQWMRDVIVGK